MALKTATYVLKSGGRPSGDPSKYDFGEIQSLLNATNPAKVSAAGAAYNKAARAMAKVAHELYLVGNSLSAKWEGADAAAAQKALGQLYTTANELYWRSQQAGQALQGYGAVLPQYKGLNWPPGGASPVEDTARQQVAEKVMKAVNQHIGNAWDAMPDKVQTNLPGLGPVSGEGSYLPGPTPSATSSGSSAPSHAGGAGAPPGPVRLSHHSDGGRGSLPGAPHGDHRTELAGAPPASGPVSAPPSAGSTSSPGITNPSVLGVGLTPGGIPPSLPSGRFGPAFLRGESAGPREIPLEQPSSSTRPSIGAPENAAATEEAQAARARTGLIGPGGAAAGAGSSEERQRSTWLSEDRTTWAAGEEPAPGVLGAGSASGRTEEEDGERERRVWLEEEREVWTGADNVLQGTIGAARSGSDATGSSQAGEPDILSVDELQKLLDSLDADAEGLRGESRKQRRSVGLLDDVADTNEIGRFLNG